MKSTLAHRAEQASWLPSKLHIRKDTQTPAPFFSKSKNDQNKMETEMQNHGDYFLKFDCKIKKTLQKLYKKLYKILKVFWTK